MGISFERRYVESKCTRLLDLTKNIYSEAPHFLRALVWLAFYIRLRWPLRGAGVAQWQKSKGDLCFISYMFNLAPNATAKGIFDSAYWGHLQEVATSKGIKTNWLNLYISDRLIPTAKKAAELINTLNQASNGMQCHVALDSFLSANIIIKVLLDWFHLLCKDMRLQMKNSMPRVSELDLWPLFESDWKSSFRGVAAISNILNFHLFHAAFTETPKRKLGLYLLENQGWEMGMLHAWKSNQHKCIVGYAHATVRYWDLRYFFDSGNYFVRKNNSLPMPDQVAVNGPVAKTAYLEAGYPGDQLIEVEALRYLYLNQIHRNKKNTSANELSNILVSQDNRKLRLLVLCDYTESQTRLMMSFLCEVAHQLDIDISIIIKPHPGFQIGSNDYPSLTYTVVNRPLAELLPNADVAFTSDITSAAVDAYCTGIPVISALDCRSLNLSPLRGFKDVTFVSNPIELLDALNLILYFPKHKFKNETIFHLEENIPRWSEIIKSLTKSEEM
jgi:surface carbohydrate biosynthesis protein (TIGR04326 family)